MAKFQVGDVAIPRKKVIIPQISWAIEMDALLGASMTITGHHVYMGEGYYTVAENNWGWPEACFDQAIPFPAAPSDAAPIEEPVEESEAARRYREKLEFRRAIGRIS